MKIEPEIIYKNPDFLILNKPAGLLTHGIKHQESRIKESTLVDWLLKSFPEIKNVGDHSAGLGQVNERPGIVHRLDRDTSGVMVIARNQEAFDYLKNLFQKHQVKKTYIALVYGHLKDKEGLIDKPLGIRSGSVKRTVHIKAARMIKEAITRYKVKKELEISPSTGSEPVKVSLLEIEPLTGRTHQIRVHLAAIGHPVVGDKLYGSKKPQLNFKRQFLHADSIEFTLPNGSRLKVGADLPEELGKPLKK